MPLWRWRRRRAFFGFNIIIDIVHGVVSRPPPPPPPPPPPLTTTAAAVVAVGRVAGGGDLFARSPGQGVGRRALERSVEVT